MFRALALTIVIAFPAGPSDILLCLVWCGDAATAPAAPGDSCHHADSSAGPRVEKNDACASLLGITAVLRDGVWRGISTLDGRAAVVAVRAGLTSPANDLARLHPPPSDWSIDKRPLTTVLRI